MNVGVLDITLVNMMMINKGGDVVNQSSNTYQSGGANSDHTDLTAKILSNNVE